MIKELGFDFSMVLEEKKNTVVEYCIHPTLEDELICKSYFFDSNSESNTSNVESLNLEASLGAKLRSSIFPKVRDLKEFVNVSKSLNSTDTSDVKCLVRDFVGGISFEELGIANLNYIRRAEKNEISQSKLFYLEKFWIDSLLQLSEGLYELQGLGYAHGDLNLSNLRLEPQGNVKVLDLGLASKLGSFKGGTPEFYSPGHLSNSLNPRSDLFAVGLHLCYWVFGNQPLLGKGLEDVSKFISSLEISPEILDRWLDTNLANAMLKYSVDWKLIIRSCLVLENFQGYEDLDELIENLEISRDQIQTLILKENNNSDFKILDEVEFKSHFDNEQQRKELDELNYFKDTAPFFGETYQLSFFKWGQNHSQLKDQWADAWQELEKINKQQKVMWDKRWKRGIPIGVVAIIIVVIFRLLFPESFESRIKSNTSNQLERNGSSNLKMTGFSDSLKYEQKKQVSPISKGRFLFKMTPELQTMLIGSDLKKRTSIWSLNHEKLLSAGIWIDLNDLKEKQFDLRFSTADGDKRCWLSELINEQKSILTTVEMIAKWNTWIKWVERPCENPKRVK